MMSSATHRSGYAAGIERDALSAKDAAAASYVPVALVLLAALFNAALAFINARIKPLTGNTVILCEVLIVAASHLYILRHFQMRMVNWYFLALAFAIFAILRISVTENLDAKYFRDVFVIVTFVQLGMTSSNRRVIEMMAALQVAVILGILLEAICLECYSDVFSVKDFYISTRGLSESDFTNLSSDLYVSATRPEARFMPFFDLHRLSSIFLEPVSLGNFMIMTAGFTAAFWQQMSNRLRAFFVASATLMLFACDGRLAALATVAIIAMSVGRRLLPRHAGLVFLPVVAGLAIFVTSTTGLKSGTDDLSGRVAYTAELLSAMSLYDFAGWSDALLERSVDAGLVYLIITQSIIGVGLIWSFMTLAADEATPEQKIYKNSLLLYLALTMMVSYSFVSIKTAAPLWFIFGALLTKPDDDWDRDADGASEQ
jgi:putative polymerase